MNKYIPLLFFMASSLSMFSNKKQKVSLNKQVAHENIIRGANIEIASLKKQLRKNQKDFVHNHDNFLKMINLSNDSYKESPAIEYILNFLLDSELGKDHRSLKESIRDHEEFLEYVLEIGYVREK